MIARTLAMWANRPRLPMLLSTAGMEEGAEAMEGICGLDTGAGMTTTRTMTPRMAWTGSRTTSPTPPSGTPPRGSFCGTAPASRTLAAYVALPHVCIRACLCLCWTSRACCIFEIGGGGVWDSVLCVDAWVGGVKVGGYGGCGLLRWVGCWTTSHLLECKQLCHMLPPKK